MNNFTKSWEELTFADNFIFCKVMKDEALCRQMIKVLLGIEIEKLVYTDTEHSIETYYGTRGIRLDVYVKGEHEGELKVFDLEMQTGNYKDLMLRARYYQSQSDAKTTPRRTAFKNLKETYIVFICKNDPFGEGLPCYTKHTAFAETDAIKYDDKTHALFYNASAWEKAEESLREVLRFIYQNEATATFSNRLENSVNQAKATPEQTEEYMYFFDELEEAKEEVRAVAREEGLAEGLAEGRSKGREEGESIACCKIAEESLRQGLSVQIISAITKLSEQEVLEIQSKMSIA